MSRWLKSVNRLLDQLDDGGVAAAAAEVGVVPQQATGVARRFWTSEPRSDEEDDDYDDEEEEEEEGEYEEEDGGDEASGEYESYDDNEYEHNETEDEDLNVDAGKESESAEVDEEEEVEFESQTESSQRGDAPRTSSGVEPLSRNVGLPPPLVEDHHTDDGVLVEPELTSDDSVSTPSAAEPQNNNSTSQTPSSTADPKAIVPLESQRQETAIPLSPSPPSLPPPPPPPVVQSKSIPTRTLPPPPPPRPPPPPSSTGNRSSASTAAASVSVSSSHNKRERAELTRLQTVNASLQQRLDAAERELLAQHDELIGAAATLKEERAILKEEKEDLLADHEEELEHLQQQHQDEVQQLHASYQSQIQALQADLKEQRSQYQKQGGDLEEEMIQARLERDEAEKQVQALSVQLREVQEASNQLAAQHDALQNHCRALEEAAESARQSERAAEARADAALEQHQRQLALRQGREAELERTVAELSAALTASQQQQQQQPLAVPQFHDSANGYSEGDAREYRAKYELAVEELETAQSELRVTVQRCEALQREVEELSRERKVESAQALQRQRDSDAQIADLTARLRQLEADKSGEDRSGNLKGADDVRIRQLLQETDDARKHVAFLSDQLMRQQGAAETYKSEVLALKGRLQAANSRADAAEVALATASTTPHDLEGGSASKTRRRIKGGARALWASRPSHLAPRSVRAALGLRVATGTAMEQVALTVDALDQWMLDTGSILKNEPLARVGLAVYLTMLHFWCFALVFFHAVESEHGDLGTLTHRGGALHPTHS